MENILFKELGPHEQDLHKKWMLEAIKEAEKARAIGEVPIGAVVVHNEEIIGRGFNIRESQHQATGHAEMIAIRQANERLKAWRLQGAKLYVTLEPCPMCAGASVLARLDQVIFAARDPKGGCGGSLMNLMHEERFNHQVEVIEGVLEAECSQLMSDFFRQLRLRKKEIKAKYISSVNIHR
ncbi:tRNA adenosine(34) deaminase TadA [Facklamia miroungae]|uniref:tRNA-specific adenosine deaminase n=1 Tax=Facklamia miroungae TaxID=120956 RepID=A0A1G7SSB1_9LACT|nr:tRNA adenosine(34) deaminase TadA [Facklamia miroungae]NKZ29555.1 tRNA adenosine(34) deaminase TadA [Facklamia miroungae]SDG25977.1 tRNA(adenine34) deaminase [Facklamia miroungae]